MANAAQLDMTCRICSSELDEQLNLPGRPVNCPCCGTYRLTPTAAQMLVNNPLDSYQATAIAYALRRASQQDNVMSIDSNFVRRNRNEARLPRVDEIIDETILWIGSEIRWPGATIEITYPECKAVLGAIDESAFDDILTTLLATNFVDGQLTSFMTEKSTTLEKCKLTPQGWGRFRELSAARVDSRHAFMAMNFGDAEMDAVFRDCFALAVTRTGFELRRLDQGQKAGSIDDQLRVRIRTSRFLLCDLTHGNRGAYWEAGFAEGLGRPVIYTCRQDVFEDPETRPHFDTNHLLTVLWNPGSMEVAAEKLAATIRETLPLEAVMEDKPIPISQ